MISHALTIVVNELNKHLFDGYGSVTPEVDLGNLAEGFISVSGSSGLARDKLYLSLVNTKEEKTLKNVQNYVRNDITLKATYENPPVFLNFLVLLTSTYTNYTIALTKLSRAVRFFQCKNVFTQDNVAPASITSFSVPIDPLDQLKSFKLIFDLYSPTMEEINHLWGTLGGKQYPFVLYMLRMLDLQFKAIHSESGLITEIVGNYYQKNAGTP